MMIKIKSNIVKCSCVAPSLAVIDYSKNGARIAKPTATAAAPRMIEIAILISISILLSSVGYTMLVSSSLKKFPKDSNIFNLFLFPFAINSLPSEIL
jgi:hypothetical protein